MIDPIGARISPIPPIRNPFEEQQKTEAPPAGTPTFLDVFKNIVGEANAAQEQRTQDMFDLLLGDVDDIERIQANITKAQVSLELLVTVKNATVEAYNEIIKMSI